jgi:hypothetical protein
MRPFEPERQSVSAIENVAIAQPHSLKYTICGDGLVTDCDE